MISRISWIPNIAAWGIGTFTAGTVAVSNAVVVGGVTVADTPTLIEQFGPWGVIVAILLIVMRFLLGTLQKDQDRQTRLLEEIRDHVITQRPPS
jgi:hypothetical protein